jgi:hypothetical protein
METAGLLRDNRSTRSTLLLSNKNGVCRRVPPHVIGNYEVRSHRFHVGMDLLFFFLCQKNIPQLMHQGETLLHWPAVQCLLHCAVRERRLVPYVDAGTSRQTENNVICLQSIGWSCCSLATPGRYMHCLCIPEPHLFPVGYGASDPDLPIFSTMRGNRVEEISLLQRQRRRRRCL